MGDGADVAPVGLLERILLCVVTRALGLGLLIVLSSRNGGRGLRNGLLCIFWRGLSYARHDCAGRSGDSGSASRLPQQTRWDPPLGRTRPGRSGQQPRPGVIQPMPLPPRLPAAMGQFALRPSPNTEAGPPAGWSDASTRHGAPAGPIPAAAPPQRNFGSNYYPSIPAASDTRGRTPPPTLERTLPSQDLTPEQYQQLQQPPYPQSLDQSVLWQPNPPFPWPPPSPPPPREGPFPGRSQPPSAMSYRPTSSTQTHNPYPPQLPVASAYFAAPQPDYTQLPAGMSTGSSQHPPSYYLPVASSSAQPPSSVDTPPVRRLDPFAPSFSPHPEDLGTPRHTGQSRTDSETPPQNRRVIKR